MPKIRDSNASVDGSASIADDKNPEFGPDDAPSVEPPSEAPVSDNTPDYSIFTTWEKRGIVLGAAVGALLSPLTGQIYLPALPAVAADLHVSIAKINLTMTTYMVSSTIRSADNRAVPCPTLPASIFNKPLNLTPVSKFPSRRYSRA